MQSGKTAMGGRKKNVSVLMVMAVRLCCVSDFDA
jgi:hypothetical protein